MTYYYQLPLKLPLHLFHSSTKILHNERIIRELKCSLVNYTITFKSPSSHSNFSCEFFSPLEVNNEVILMTACWMDIGKLKESLMWSNTFSSPWAAWKTPGAQSLKESHVALIHNTYTLPFPLYLVYIKSYLCRNSWVHLSKVDT